MLYNRNQSFVINSPGSELIPRDIFSVKEQKKRQKCTVEKIDQMMRIILIKMLYLE
jgi:hypothetical protein